MSLPDVTADPDRDALYALFEREPGDRAAYGAMADRLDEIGHAELAHAYRWMCLRGRWPHGRLHYHAGLGQCGRAVSVHHRFAWYSEGITYPREITFTYPQVPRKPHSLPALLMPGDQKAFRTHQQAVMWLAERLAALKADYSAEPPKGAGL